MPFLKISRAWFTRREDDPCRLEVQPEGRSVFLAIGFFDGVHLGHRSIIELTVKAARRQGVLSLVVTFDRHPSCVVSPAHVPRLICPLAIKVLEIGRLAPEALLLLHFDKQLSEVRAEAFVRALAGDVEKIGGVCVGRNFRFGHNREGDVRLLEDLGKSLGFSVTGLPAVQWDGRAISSTRIRRAIAAGDLRGAGEMLGRSHALSGQVIRGDGLGRQLGFPTANLDVEGLVLPPAGVYAAHARVNDRRYMAVLNIGHRPTLNRPDLHLRVEAHLLDFSEDLYGRQLEVVPQMKLRDERRFPSLEALRDQISKDIAAASAGATL